jgi:hypothetical protein
MNNYNDRPSRALFGDAASQPLQSKSFADSGRANFLMLQYNIRSRKAISQLEVEPLKEIIENANLTDRELGVLKDIAKGRASDSERSLGWHCGFEDLVGHLESMMAMAKAA